MIMSSSLRCCLMQLQDLCPNRARHWRWISAMCHALRIRLDSRFRWSVDWLFCIWFARRKVEINHNFDLRNFCLVWPSWPYIHTTSNYKIMLNKAWAGRTCFWQWLLVCQVLDGVWQGYGIILKPRCWWYPSTMGLPWDHGVSVGEISKSHVSIERLKSNFQHLIRWRILTKHLIFFLQHLHLRKRNKLWQKHLDSQLQIHANRI